MLKKIAIEASLWILAVLITVFSAGYQRKTGPTYPIDGETTFADTNVTYTLLRSHGGEGDQPVEQQQVM